MTTVGGLHHVTAIAGDAQRNVAFYAGLLGLRLVKRTVNYDDPTTYHLYYGDGGGRPGSVLTFFPWHGLRAGRPGTGMVAATALAVPQGSLDWWAQRLTDAGLAITGPCQRFGAGVIGFADHDGLALELVENAAAAGMDAPDGAVPRAHAIRGLDGVTLWSASSRRTGVMLRALGLAPDASEEGVDRYVAGNGPIGRHVDVKRCAGERGIAGAGTVHHAAFRAGSVREQMALRTTVIEHGADPTRPVNRQYFSSVYFREPGHVLLELATDGPGFTVDEPADTLGTTLTLPPWLEPHRATIERTLPVLEAPAAREDRAEDAA